MASKHKMTSFSRFLIFLTFFAPLAYLGASYYNGEDGIENVKRMFDGKSSEDLIKEKKELIIKHENEILLLKNEIMILQAK